jgi:hypothetical protein
MTAVHFIVGRTLLPAGKDSEVCRSNKRAVLRTTVSHPLQKGSFYEARSFVAKAQTHDV